VAGILIIVLAGIAALLWFLGATEPRQRLRDAAFYLLCLDLVLVGLVIANYVAGGRP
jgi:hypothetical protein